MRPIRSLPSVLLALVATFVFALAPASAQSRLRDAETEALLDDMIAPLVEASELEPGNVEVVLINDSSINAFVAGGQVVYVHSGLINAAETANEVQGVLAHELGHITAGHVVRFEERTAGMQSMTLLSLLAGAASVLAGAPAEAGMSLFGLGMQAGVANFLSFNRNQEAATDLAGARYLSGAGISGRGMLKFFERLRNFEIRRGYSQADEAAYGRTHPLSGDRVATLRELLEKDPAWDAPEDPDLQERFLQVRAKLFGYIAEPALTLRLYPESDTTLAGHYARAYAYHKDALIAEALAAADTLLASDPDNPYYLELQGQILLESGRVEEALIPLRRATRMTRNNPLIASMFGHALIATEDESNYDEAERVLRAAVARDRFNPFAWYQLGVVYAARGDIPRAKLASAEQLVMRRSYPEALQNALAAEAALPRGSPDWIRAQDIALEARSALERLRDRR
ncbi:MAG: M48 family metalloprotease [Erythrobacter sp.]|uniref:M48 family metalloprotease n=1 Tax=Erythrobacter sp. TaxID=1042 RepID=UPI002635FF4F|nr:M48 family metalloprotease [Erythrobacter sp.]MDJ0978552.1 M48 family metalloprotease [Erythrobacter sp.]